MIFDYRWKCRWFEVDIDAVPRAEINVRYQLPPPLPRPTPLTDAEIKSNLEAEIQAAEEELKLNAGQHWARYNLLNARLILHQAQMDTRDALSDYQRAQAEFDEAVESEVVRV